MTDPIQALSDIEDAGVALIDWFRSQDISPADSIMICEAFLGKMIAANSKGIEDAEEKFTLANDTIREYCLLYVKAMSR